MVTINTTTTIIIITIITTTTINTMIMDCVVNLSKEEVVGR